MMTREDREILISFGLMLIASCITGFVGFYLLFVQLPEFPQ